MARYKITSNPATGFDHVFRGYPESPAPRDERGNPEYPAGFGWAWPGKGITIEVVSQAEDPDQDVKKLAEAGVERFIGQRTWKALQDDPRIFAGPINSVDGDTASAALTAANDEIADLKRQLAEARGEAPTPAPEPKAAKKK